MSETLRFWLAALLLGAGALVMLLAMLGVYRFRYALNRLHCAAVGDTLGLLLLTAGLLVAAGSWEYVPKLLLLGALLWLGNPVASRLVARLELDTGEDLEQHMDREDRT